MKIAVIGTGIAGLSAAWLLHRRYDVTVFEQNGHAGGHSNTVEATGADGNAIPVDTGFIVYNDATYPNLIALFDHLGVPTKPSDMSFSVSLDRGRLEYAGDTLFSLFAQRRNLLRPGFYAMIADILRFFRRAERDAADPAFSNVTLGDYLDAKRYGERFRTEHLVPMGAAIWSSPMADIMAFPFTSFVRFFSNHGLLKLTNRPLWRTVDGGSRAYVARLTAAFADRIRLNRPVDMVLRHPTHVEVTSGGETERFDQVVLACHGDHALELLGDADRAEERVLGGFRYQRNRAVLHRDPALMPRRRAAWASWNYLAGATRDPKAQVAVTYWMNRLQSIDRATPLFVTLNPLQPPAPATVIREIDYEHPVLDGAAITAQGALPGIQGRNHTWFCGAHCGYGFHEDGLCAGLAVAEALGCPRPWTVTDVSPAGRNATPATPTDPPVAAAA